MRYFELPIRRYIVFSPSSSLRFSVRLLAVLSADVNVNDLLIMD